MAIDESRPTPPPTLVAAWEALGTLRTEEVPMWAAHWLADGIDGEGILALACIDASDVREIHDAIPAALRDAGIDQMSELAAAARLSFDHIARMHLDGHGGWRWVISSVSCTLEQNDHAAEFLDEPLGALFGLEDEVAAAWGRSDVEIQDEVREACERQVRSGSGAGDMRMRT